jgi:hypothetical protein
MNKILNNELFLQTFTGEVTNTLGKSESLIGKIIPADKIMLEFYKFLTFQKTITNKRSLINSNQETMSNLIPENTTALQNIMTNLINPIIPAIQKTLDIEKFILFQEKIFISQESISTSVNLIPQIVKESYNKEITTMNHLINQIAPAINKLLNSYKFTTFHNSINAWG